MCLKKRKHFHLKSNPNGIKNIHKPNVSFEIILKHDVKISIHI